MDIEKLIERLQQYSQSLIAYKLDADFADACEDAVAAISTLQTEAKGMRSNWYKSVEKIKELQAELEEMTQRNDENLGMCRIWEHRYTELQAENEELKEKLYDGEGVNLVNYWMQQAKIEENGHRNCQAELEQAKEEITRLKYYEDKCHDCPIVCAKTEIIKAHEELETVQAELEQVKAERDAAVDCIYKIEDALDRGNDNDWAREHISEWESQKED